jgi:hypothetical protein
LHASAEAARRMGPAEATCWRMARVGAAQTGCERAGATCPIVDGMREAPMHSGMIGAACADARCVQVCAVFRCALCALCGGVGPHAHVLHVFGGHEQRLLDNLVVVERCRERAQVTFDLCDVRAVHKLLQRHLDALTRLHQRQRRVCTHACTQSAPPQAAPWPPARATAAPGAAAAAPALCMRGGSVQPRGMRHHAHACGHPGRTCPPAAQQALG